MLFRLFESAGSRPARHASSRPLNVEFLEGRLVPSGLGATLPPSPAAAPQAAPARLASSNVETATANGPWIGRHGMTSAQYQSWFTTYANLGYRLADVSGSEEGGQARYAALWVKSSGPAWTARHGLTPAQYQAAVTTLSAQGYRPVVVDGYTVGGAVYYAAVFHKSTGVMWGARHGLTATQYQAVFTSFANAGYRLVSVSGYSVGGQDYYAGVWAKVSGPLWFARHGLTASEYQSEFTRLANLGYQPADVSAWSVNGQDRYAALWHKSSTPFVAHHGMTSAQYATAFKKYFNQGYRLHTVDASTVNGQTRYMAVWRNLSYTSAQLRSIENNVADFMEEYGVPGASLAISKDDRLVYAGGFGVSDQSTGAAVTVDSRFRIASVSKPITSAAIFRLIDQGKVKLTDKVFGTGALLGTTYGTNAYSTAVKAITVRHLLEHTAGGWGNSSNDPMFSNPTMNLTQLIGWTLDNRALTNTPGTTYSYSNFGYCVLGRVIEKITGQTYANAVQSLVLTPSGITGMTIGGNTLAERQANEVRYYGQGGQDPYNMQVTRMDAHGGWVASATDLLRFATRVNGVAGRPDILTPGSIATMTTASAVGSGYAKGWSVNASNNWWHNGSLPGTASILVRTSGGYTWSMLLNTRSLDSGFFSALDQLMWKIVGDVGTFPTINLW